MLDEAVGVEDTFAVETGLRGVTLLEGDVAVETALLVAPLLLPLSLTHQQLSDFDLVGLD